MEGQTPYRTKSREDVRAIQEKHRGEVLTNNQVIDFVNNAGIGIDSSVVWFGYEIPLEDTPFYRFSKILEGNYDRLNPNEKLQFLSSAGKFVLGAIRPTVSIPHSWVMFVSRKEYTDYKLTKFSIHPLEIRTRNTGEYLARCLEFCQGDVQKSKEFIIGNLKDFDPKIRKESNRSPFIEFYKYIPQKDSERYREGNEPIKAISAYYINISPKIAQLTFLLEANLFGFSPGLLKYLLESVFPNTHADVKTEIMRYISQRILNGDFAPAALLDVSLFLAQNRNFYSDLIKRNPDDQLARHYALADKSLMLHNLIEKTRRKEILVDDLVDFLEQNPFLIKYVSNEELEKALNLTKDHGTALRIERIMREKSR